MFGVRHRDLGAALRMVRCDIDRRHVQRTVYAAVDMATDGEWTGFGYDAGIFSIPGRADNRPPRSIAYREDCSRKYMGEVRPL